MSINRRTVLTGLAIAALPVPLPLSAAPTEPPSQTLLHLVGRLQWPSMVPAPDAALRALAVRGAGKAYPLAEPTGNETRDAAFVAEVAVRLLAPLALRSAGIPEFAVRIEEAEDLERARQFCNLAKFEFSQVNNRERFASRWSRIKAGGLYGICSQAGMAQWYTTLGYESMGRLNHLEVANFVSQCFPVTDPGDDDLLLSRPEWVWPVLLAIIDGAQRHDLELVRRALPVPALFVEA